MARTVLFVALGATTAVASFVGGVGVGHPVQSHRTVPVRAVATNEPAVAVDDATVPDGVLRRNTRGRAWVEQRQRPRRNRKSEAVRKMVRETIVTPSNFIYPLFIHDETSNVAIPVSTAGRSQRATAPRARNRAQSRAIACNHARASRPARLRRLSTLATCLVGAVDAGL